MSIIDEILAKECSLLERAGFGEKVLYYFLTDRIRDQQISLPSGEIDRVCYAAFVPSNLDVSKEINRAMSSSPIKGAHFSNNLISLIAFSKLSTIAKSQYLKKYYDTHSLLDKFIIKRVFEELDLNSSTLSQTLIDNLLDEVFIKHNLHTESMLVHALEVVDSLMGLYAIRASYEKLLSIHPNKEIENRLNKLSELFGMLIKKNKRRINRIANGLIVSCGVIVGGLIVFFVKKYWDDWSLEPIFTGVGFVIPIIAAIYYALYKKEPGGISTYLISFKKGLFDCWLRKNGLDVEDIEEI